MDTKTIEWLYISYSITISQTSFLKIALDQVATFSLQPAAEGLNELNSVFLGQTCKQVEQYYFVNELK